MGHDPNRPAPSPAHAHAHAHAHPPAHAPAPAHAHAHAPAPERDPLERGAGRGKLLFIDAFSGIAGDMLVAALVDLGVSRELIERGLRALPLSGYELRFERRMRGAIAACGFDVQLQKAQPARDYAQIRGMFEAAAGLPEGARRLALDAFRLLAEAEAEVHGTSVERVHFHEVGAVDSIVDVAAAAIALDHLGAEVVASPLPIGRGMVLSQHGPLPLPAPATLLCLRGVPTYDANIDAELVTPTGACLLRAAARHFARWPELRPLRVGWGAGTRELADRPNALRLVLGDATGPIAAGATSSSHVVLELNVDDMTGELAAVALARAQHAGALDVWSTPIGMKKGRPALMLSALSPRADVDAVARALLSETTSLGLRLREVGRIERARRMVSVQTPYGAIAVKVADGDGLPRNVAPEYEACQRAAEAHGVPVKHVYAAAVAAYLAQGEAP
jgi:uncharacterized protein (TIGR00299 family) protein